VPHYKNLITKLLKYRKIIDIPNSITSMPYFIKALKHLTERKRKGTYNVVCSNPITHLDIVKIYESLTGTAHAFEIITLDELDTMVVAKRSNCILSTKKLEAEGVTVPTAEDAVSECVKEYVKR